MAEDLGNLQVRVGADIAAFEAGMAKVQADLVQVATAAESSGGRYIDAQGKMREANGRFVSSATLAAEAARNMGGTLGTLSDSATKAATSINGGLVSSFANFDRVAKPLQEGVGRLGEGLKSFGTGLTAAVTLPLTLVGGASLKMAGDLEVAKVAFTTMLGSAEAATATLNDLKKFAADTPFEFPEIQDAAKKLLAFNTPAAELKETLRQLGDISAGIGAPIGEIADLFGKARVQGRLFQEDINQLTGRGIPIIQELAKQFNVTEDGVRKLVESGKVNFGNLQTAFANLTKEGGKFGGLMEAQSQTIPGLFSTLSDNAGQALAGLGQDIAAAFDLKGVINTLSGFIQTAADGFRSLSTPTKEFIIIGAGVAAALGPIVFALGSVVSAIPAVVAGLETLGLASAAALGPLAIGVAAVAAAAVLIIENWDDMVAYFTTGEGGKIFGDLADSVSNAVSQITSAFSALNGSGDFSGLVTATGVIKTLFEDIAIGVTALSNVVGGTIGAISKLFSSDFTGAVRQAERALIGLAQPLANVLGFQLRLAPATQAATEKFDALALTLPGLAANLAALSTPFPIANIANADAIAKQVGILEGLKQKLKEVQDQRDKETNVASIAADNARIISLQKQIAALEGTDKASKKATDAITKLRQELARLGALDNFLGDAPSEAEVLERRADTLEKGLKTLVDNGVSTASRSFRGFATDLVTTRQALEKLTGAGQSLDLKPVEVKSLIPTTIGDTLDADVARLLGDYAKQAKPFELPIAVKLNMQAILDAPKPFQIINTELENLGASFRKIGVESDLFGGKIGAAFNGFDIASEQASATRAALQDLIDKGFGPMDPVVRALSRQLQDYGTQSESVRAITSGLQDGFVALGTSIGTSLGDGSNVLNAGLAALIDVLAEYASKKGKLLIADGLADLFIPGAQAVGALKIAAGTGLLVAAGVASAGANSLRGSGGSAASVSSPSTNYNSSASGPQGVTQIKVVAEFKLRGADLVAVGRLNGYRELRTN